MSEDSPAHLAGFQAGSLLAGYRLEAQVGAGGMAVVFQAHDERLDRRVALKILVPTLASNPEFRRRFIAESRATVKVEDPHIIPVYEADEADGVLFIAMRFVAGDLRRVLRSEGPMRPERAAEFISPVASALDAAHAQDLVHRDVKPANILVDARAGRPDFVYLSDFGIAKAMVSSVNVTATGLILGTPDYAAPEQIDGRAVTGRTDQYALACVSYELLTGQTPFKRNTMVAVLMAQVQQPPAPLTTRRPDLPTAVDHVIATALAKNPENRYQSCVDFADALREALGLSPYHDHGRAEAPSSPKPPRDPPTEPASLAASPTENPPSDELLSPTLSAALAAEALPTGAPPTDASPEESPGPDLRVPTISFVPEPPVAPTRPSPPPGAVPPTQDIALPTAGPGTEAVAVPEGTVPSAETAPAGSQPGSTEAGSSRPPRLIATPEAAGSPGVTSVSETGGAPRPFVFADVPQAVVRPSRDWRRRLPLVAAVAAVVGAAAVIPFVLSDRPGSPGPGRPGSPSPSVLQSGSLGSSAPSGRVNSRPAGRPAPLELPSDVRAGGGRITSLAFSPAGTSLAIADTGKICVWNIAARQCTAKLTSAWAVAFSPDGTTLAASDDQSDSTGGPNGTIRQWEIPSGKQRGPAITNQGSGGALSVAFSPDGKTLATGDVNGPTYLWGAATGSPMGTLTDPGTKGVNAVAFSPDGSLAVGDGNGSVYLWNVSTRKQITSVHGSGSQGVQAVTFGKGGKVLAAGDSNGRTYVWQRSGVSDWRLIKVLPVPPAAGSQQRAVSAVTFSPDGTRLAVGDRDGTADVWNAATWQRIKSLQDANGGGETAVAFNYDGKTLATGDELGSVYLWPLS